MPELDERILAMGHVVREQLTDALAAFTGHDTRNAEVVIERDDIVDNSRSALEERCFELLRKAPGVLEARRARSALRVVQNLERIGDAASHIAKHCLLLASDGDEGFRIGFDDLSEIALTGVDEALRSFIESDIMLAQQACEREPQLDALYIARIEQVADMIDNDEMRGRTVLHVLAVLKYLEKVCDFVLNIGETTVYSVTGTRLSYPQFQELQALLPGSTGNGVDSYRHFWDGISGATVIEVGRPEGQRVVFKEGAGAKIEQEFYKTLEWEGIAPEHTARVIGITRAKGRNGLLREFAEGSLLVDVLLSDSYPEVKEAVMRQVTDVLSDIWRTTITPLPPKIDYIAQIRSRLREVLRRHPGLAKIAKEDLEDFGGLYDTLSLLAAREPFLAPPFSIWTHGDLNADNIVIDRESKSVVFIDVHRSRYGDYLQDVAVLATSPERRFPKGKAAKGVRRANELLFGVAEDFASTNGDHHFRMRMRLARARAFITSARLQQDGDHARILFEQGLEHLVKVARGLKIAKKG